MISIVAIADPHIGANRFGVTAEEWNRPLFEAVEYAVEHSVDYFMVAGDVFHSRRPTPDDYVVWQRVQVELHKAGVEIVAIPGNHDEPAAADRPNTLWHHLNGDKLSGVHIQTLGSREGAKTLTVLRLGWPRPVDFINADYLRTLSIDEAIAVTREEVLSRLQEFSGKVTALAPTILLGHCMVSYGGVKADDPGLILGKDVVLPAEELRSLPALPILGHVHRPDSLYVGSTQPTDFGEAEQEKCFWHIQIAEMEEEFGARDGSRITPFGQFIHVTTPIPYKTSLRLLDVEIQHADVPNILEGLAYQIAGLATTDTGQDQQHDIARARIHTSADLDPAAVRKMLLQHAKRVHAVEVIRPRRTVARVETATPLAAMSPLEAFDAWLQDMAQSEEGKAARELFHRMVTHE